VRTLQVSERSLYSMRSVTLSQWRERRIAVILKYAGTMAPLAPILLVVGGAKAELAHALVPCETGAMLQN